MDRKNFIKTTLPLLAASSGISMRTSGDPEIKKKLPYLKKGDTIGITCPSGFITLEDVQPCIKKLEEWGFKVRLGRTVGLRDFTFAGSDGDRTADLQQMLDDDSIDAVLLGRGGYGAVRIIDNIHFGRFSKKPKWVIGFSDATVLHLHLNCKLNIPSVHSKMCNSFPEDESRMIPGQADSIDSIRRVLLGEAMRYEAPTLLQNRPGDCEGKLVGGNLSIIQMLCGSQSAVKTDNAILFLEDVGEYLYRLDGMMWNLKRSGKLEKLKGLIIGSFRIKPDEPDEEFGLSLYDIVMEKVKEYTYPVCFDFPCGHVAVNYALKSGAKHHLVVTTDNAILTSLE